MQSVKEILVTALATIALLAPSPIAAQDAQDKAVAEQLFDKARPLMRQGRYADACPLLEQSYQLDPATGTQLNLANCYEHTGRLASAWGHYREVAEKDRRVGKKKRAAFAQSRADELEPRIPRLTIEVPEDSRVPGLEVTRDGEAVAPALFGVAVYVDEGTYRIVAAAEGLPSHSVDATARDGQETTIEIPRLEPEPTGARAEPVRPRSQDRAPSGKSPRRAIGLGVGSAGLAAMAVGVGFGLAARSSWNDAFERGLCDRDTLICDLEGQGVTDTARSRADVATVLLSSGAVFTAAGVLLYLTAPRAEARPAALTVTPLYGPNDLGIAVSGRF